MITIVIILITIVIIFITIMTILFPIAIIRVTIPFSFLTPAIFCAFIAFVAFITLFRFFAFIFFFYYYITFALFCKLFLKCFLFCFLINFSYEFIIWEFCIPIFKHFFFSFTNLILSASRNCNLYTFSRSTFTIARVLYSSYSHWVSVIVFRTSNCVAFIMILLIYKSTLRARIL